MKKENSQNPGTAIKCRFSNEVHKLINPYYGIQHRKRWSVKKKELTTEEKAELFDKIAKLDAETSEELGHYFYTRRERKRIRKSRGEQYYIDRAEKRKAKREFNS